MPRLTLFVGCAEVVACAVAVAVAVAMGLAFASVAGPPVPPTADPAPLQPEIESENRQRQHGARPASVFYDVHDNVCFLVSAAARKCAAALEGQYAACARWPSSVSARVRPLTSRTVLRSALGDRTSHTHDPLGDYICGGREIKPSEAAPRRAKIRPVRECDASAFRERPRGIVSQR